MQKRLAAWIVLLAYLFFASHVGGFEVGMRRSGHVQVADLQTGLVRAVALISGGQANGALKWKSPLPEPVVVAEDGAVKVGAEDDLRLDEPGTLDRRSGTVAVAPAGPRHPPSVSPAQITTLPVQLRRTIVLTC